MHGADLMSQTLCKIVPLEPSERLVPFQPTQNEMRVYPMLKYADKCWIYDDQYIAAVNEINGFLHLKVRRIDDDPITDFYVFQRIKNRILGDEVVAVQVYPKESDLVDGSNTYHLWSWQGIEGEVPNLKDMPRYH